MEDSNTAFFYLNTIETVAIVIENIFTIYVFWNNNTEAILLSSWSLSSRRSTSSNNGNTGYWRSLNFLYLASKSSNLLAAFQTTFSLAPLIVFSMLVSLERLYALLRPPRHRISTMSSFIYSSILAWVALRSHSCVVRLLAVYNLVELFHWTVTYLVVIHLCLIVMCASCLTF